MSAKSSPRSFRRNISLSFDNHFNYLGNDPIPSLSWQTFFRGKTEKSRKQGNKTFLLAPKNKLECSYFHRNLIFVAEAKNKEQTCTYTICLRKGSTY